MFKRAARIVLFCFFIAALCLSAQTTRQAVPNSGRKPNRPFQGGNNFMDFSMDKINPANVNYGEKIEQDREIAIEESIDNALFWSNLMAAFVALGLGIMVFFQSKERIQREILASECLAFYHNQLVDAEEQIEKATHRYERLKQSVDEQAERALVTNKGIGQKGGQSVEAGSATSEDAAAEIKRLTEELKKTNRDIVQKDTVIGNLKQQLREVSRKLNDEQQKNQQRPSDGSNAA